MAVLLHEVETSDDDPVLIREAARQSPDSARDEYTGFTVDKELRQGRLANLRNRRDKLGVFLFFLLQTFESLINISEEHPEPVNGHPLL